MKLKDLIEELSTSHGSQEEIRKKIERYSDTLLKEKLFERGTLQQAFSVSPLEMEELYGKGYEWYEQEIYEKAEDCFRWLVLLNPFENRYWLGLGASQQMSGRIESALKAYAVASIIEPESPYPHVYAYECFRLQENFSEAEKALEMARHMTKEHEHYKDLYQELEAL